MTRSIKDLHIDYTAACWAVDHHAGKTATQRIADYAWWERSFDAYWTARLRPFPKP